MRIELHYLPNIEYFALLKKFDEIEFDIAEFYQKQSYRNRCYILGANKTQLLTVPVKDGNKRIQSKDIQIDYNQKWLNVHLRAIQSAYGKAPFFEYYFDYFNDIFVRKEKYLVDLNYEMLSLCLKLLQFDSVVKKVEKYMDESQESDNQFINFINRKQNASERHIYQPYAYQQLFGSKFVPNLSIIDLLFCEGPGASSIVGLSTV